MLSTDSSRQYLENKRVELQKRIGGFCNGGSFVTTFESECVFAVLKDQLRQVENALARYKEGTYGLCQRCGKPIDPARLRVLPCATMCVRCKNHQENSKNQRSFAKGGQVQLVERK